MTDNDTKKALDELVKLSSGIIIDWEINQNDAEAIYKIAKNALDLINRKDAEIERLEEDIRRMVEKEITEVYRYGVVNQYGAFFTKSPKEYYEMLADIRAEAIKEFAERLKDLTITLGGKYRYDVATKEGIDYLVKEMTESPSKMEHSSLCETETYTIVGEPKKLSKKESRELRKKAQKPMKRRSESMGEKVYCAECIFLQNREIKVNDEVPEEMFYCSKKGHWFGVGSKFEIVGFAWCEDGVKNDKR